MNTNFLGESSPPKNLFTSKKFQISTKIFFGCRFPRVYTRWFIYIKFHDAIKYLKRNKEMFEKMGLIEK